MACLSPYELDGGAQRVAQASWLGRLPLPSALLESMASLEYPARCPAAMASGVWTWTRCGEVLGLRGGWW